MGVHPQHDWSAGSAGADWQALVVSTLDWWRDAGVDTLVEDVPRDWFAVPVAAEAPSRPMPVAAAAVLSSVSMLPITLAALIDWRVGADAPEAAWSGISIAASGPANADVMVLVDCPDREDGPAATMLSGTPGRLFDRMLAAIGLSRGKVHLAAVCARRPAAGRIDPAIEARLAEIARHHIQLVAPKRLLLLGNAASRAILGAEVALARGNLHGFNHDGRETAAVASFHPRFLIERPALKAEAWKDLQMLIGGMA